MRKIFSSLVSLCAIIALGVMSKSPVFYDANGEVTYYCNKKNSLCTIVTVNSDYEENYRSLKNVKGECVEKADYEYVEKTLKRLKAIKSFSETVDGIKCDYYYTPLIKDSVVVRGRTVNLHVAKRGEGYAIATPMIFGSY